MMPVLVQKFRRAYIIIISYKKPAIRKIANDGHWVKKNGEFYLSAPGLIVQSRPLTIAECSEGSLFQ